MHQFIRDDLRPDQKRKRASHKSSCFAAMLKNKYGGKRFVMAILQTGTSWRDSDGGNDVAKLVEWILAVSAAITEHKNDPAVAVQRQKSGFKKFSNGLTEEERRKQQNKRQAYHAFNTGRELNDRLAMAKGNAKGNGKHNSRRTPLRWDQMTQNEQWHVWNFQQGNLHAWKKEARNAYQPRDADTPYFMFYRRESDAHAGASEHS